MKVFIFNYFFFSIVRNDPCTQKIIYNKSLIFQIKFLLHLFSPAKHHNVTNYLE